MFGIEHFRTQSGNFRVVIMATENIQQARSMTFGTMETLWLPATAAKI